jgi:DMSO/TMAO reductase YedYZ molybdopterin-dependent catalytic subunit
MPRPSRRTFLKAAGSLLLASVYPAPSLAGLFDGVFGRPDAKAATPITPNDEFYVTSYRSPPTIRINDWSLLVKGLVEHPITLTYEQLIAKPVVKQIVTLECVGNTVAGEFMSTAAWDGVSLQSLLQEAGVRSDAYDVVFRAADGYSDSIRFDRAMMGDVLIAHKMNGVPLPQGHGFPARAIVPGHYGMKSVQWLAEIVIVGQDYKGYYAQKGWTDEAVVKTTSRIDLPRHGTTIKGLHHRIEGLAFAGTRGIGQVEISTDGGEHWMPTTLDTPLSPSSWVLWHFDWIASESARHTLLVRATDGMGRLQTSIKQEPAPDGASGLHEITVSVEA